MTDKTHSRLWLFLLTLAILVAGGGIAVFVQNETDQRTTSDQNETAASTPVESVAASPTIMAATAVVREENTRVSRVIDGDTIVLESGGRVRLIGIDTPETRDPRRGVQCYGEISSRRTKELLEGQDIRLEKDVSETDRYGRLLRYVWHGDVLINEQLAAEGFARASSYPPDIKHQDRLQAAEKTARENRRGLWGACPQY